MRALHEAADYLIEIGGTDMVIRPHGLYEITVRRLDEDAAEKAVRNLIEEKGNERRDD